MHKPSDYVLLQPNLVFGSKQVNFYDAMNLVAYAKVPLVSVRRAEALIAGYIRREERKVVGAILSQGQKDRLFDRYRSELAALRFPVAPFDYATLQEKMLDAGETAIPYFFHEHHELIHSRRRAWEMAQINTRLLKLVHSGEFKLQITESQHAGFPVPSEAWMTQKSLGLYLEDEGVSPFWEDQQNLKSHARLVRITLSDSWKVSQLDGPEPINNEQLPSYRYAEMLLTRSPSYGYAATPSIEHMLDADAADIVGTRKSSSFNKEFAKNLNRQFLVGGESELPEHAHEPHVSLQSSTSTDHEILPSRRDTKTVKPRRTKVTTRETDGDYLEEPEVLASGKMLSKKEVAEILGISVGTVDNRRNDDPNFPQPYAYSSNKKLWDEAEVLAWKQKQPRG